MKKILFPTATPRDRLLAYFKFSRPGEKKFYDIIPPPAEKKYLKTIYHCRQCAGTPAQGDIDGDGELAVLDLDFIISNPPANPIKETNKTCW